MLLAGALHAGVVGSPHDFSGLLGVAPSGTCSACHIPHKADSKLLWARRLGRYQQELGRVAGGGSNPNYILGSTKACYDCHDSVTAKLDTVKDDNTAYTYEIPLFTDFDLRHKPPAIAFGMVYTGSPDNTLGYDGDWTQDHPGGAVSGFFETVPRANPGTTDTTDYGVGTVNWPTDNTVMPGGHYFKSADPDSPTVRKGDKIPCNICHDPHATANQAFIRNPLAGSTLVGGAGGKASNRMANSAHYTPSLGTRNPSDSRRFCIHCHGDSNQLTYTAKRYSNLGYTGSSQLIAPPPSTVSAHSGLTGVACTSCHKHNSIEAGCNSCHSYPGLDNSTSPRQMSAVHWKHVGKPGAGGLDQSRYPLDCKVCHFGYEDTHPGNNIGPGGSWSSYDPSKVDIRFDPAKNPGTPKYNDNNAYSQAAPGNGVTGVCAGLYCHGDTFPKKTGTDQTPDWFIPATGACGTCHGNTGTQMNSNNHPVHLDNASKPYGPGIDNVTCGNGSACHTAYGLNPSSTHVDTIISFRTAHDNPAATDNNLTQICDACHSKYAVPYFDNSLVPNNSPAKTGVQLAKENWTDNAYRLPCLTCHNNSGRTVGGTSSGNMQANFLGRWAPGIEKYWKQSGHGDNTIDNTSTSQKTATYYQVLPVSCGYCHAVDSQHFGNTTAGNRWRLASSTGYAAAGGLDKFCATWCHGSGSWLGTWAINRPDVPQDHFWNVAASEVRGTAGESDTHPTARDVYAPAVGCPPTCSSTPPASTDYMPLDGDIRSGGGTNFLCVTCHDPHGTGAGDADHWYRSWAGDNDNVIRMLRYINRETTNDLCHKCHYRP